jgi:hypothetical protein
VNMSVSVNVNVNVNVSGMFLFRSYRLVCMFANTARGDLSHGACTHRFPSRVLQRPPRVVGSRHQTCFCICGTASASASTSAAAGVGCPKAVTARCALSRLWHIHR